MEPSVETLCNHLAKHKLLDSETIRTLPGRWRTEGKSDAEDVKKFGKWLVGKKYLTDFQADLLIRGLADLLFIDEYKLIERIGQGRMAGVYKAVHNLGQVVAIKVLPPSKAKHPQLLARFQREARLAMRLNHPNAVRTFQQGITRGGLNYLVMEHLDGEALEDVLKRRGQLPVAEAVHVALHVLEGLQHLQDEGLVHRDLKPGNLMLVPATQDSVLKATVKILDIGLGRALFDDGPGGLPENPELTTEGTLLGTPRYMAPEQARSARTADIRADIYSLGCILYEMLAGEAPFPDTNLMRQIMRHATEMPRCLRDLNREVSQELWEVVETMLTKDPAQRYALPSQASKALQPLVDPKVARLAPGDDPPEMKNYVSWVKTKLALEPPVDEERTRGEGSRSKEGDSLLLEPSPLVLSSPAVMPPIKPAGVSGPLAPTPLAAGAVSGPVPMAASAAKVPMAVAAPPQAKVAPAAAPAKPPPPGASAQAPKPGLPVTAAPPAQPPARPAGKLLGWLQGALGWLEKRGISRRDLRAAGVGAGVLLLLELLVWFLWRWLTTG